VPSCAAAFLPVFGHPLAVVVQASMSPPNPGHHVGVQAVNDGAGLLAGAAMRLFDGTSCPVLAFQCLAKRGIELDVQFAGRVVRHVQQRDRWLGDTPNAATARTAARVTLTIRRRVLMLDSLNSLRLCDEVDSGGNA